MMLPLALLLRDMLSALFITLIFAAATLAPRCLRHTRHAMFIFAAAADSCWHAAIAMILRYYCH